MFFISFFANLLHYILSEALYTKTNGGSMIACQLSSVCKKIEKEFFGTNVMQIVKSQVGIISLDSQDPRILEICKKARRRPCHWTIYQELCQLIIRAVQSLLCWIKMWRSLIQRLSLGL